MYFSEIGVEQGRKEMMSELGTLSEIKDLKITGVSTATSHRLGLTTNVGGDC